MNNCLLCNRSIKFINRPIIQRTLFIASFLFIATNINIVQAQSNPSDAVNSGSTNLNDISPRQFDNVQPYSFPVNAGGSQQFFRQENDRLYFLPEESESKSILQIDETVEAEGIKYEDLQKKPLDE